MRGRRDPSGLSPFVDFPTLVRAVVSMYHNKDVDNKERFKSLKKDLEGKEEWRLRNILVSEEKKIEEV